MTITFGNVMVALLLSGAIIAAFVIGFKVGMSARGSVPTQEQKDVKAYVTPVEKERVVRSA